MGEIIREIGVLHIGDESLRVELNHGQGDGYEHEIHVQNDKIRLSMSEVDFCRMATGVLLARKQLRMIKSRDFETVKEQCAD